MNLRDQIMIDNQRTFLNPKEFADIYNIDGKPVKAVLHSASDNKHPLAYAEGVSLVTDTLKVDAMELGRTPKQGSYIKINGTDYKIVQVGSEKGMLSLYLEVNAG